MSFISNWFKNPEKRTPPLKVESYDYKVTERKDEKGVSYYVGSSFPFTERYILAECPYNKRRWEERWRGPRYEIHSCIPKYVPKYVLLPAVSCYTLGGRGASSLSPVYARFKDPVEVRDTICRIRKEQQEALDNKNYCKVVSKGDCKCP